VKNNTIEGILNKIKWTTPKEEMDKYEVMVIDRKSLTGFTIISLNEGVQVLRDRIITGNKVIPLHRVVEIRYKGSTIWRRNAYRQGSKG
jgi:uncharacterized protein (UPF0248 family)